MDVVFVVSFQTGERHRSVYRDAGGSSARMEVGGWVEDISNRNGVGHADPSRWGAFIWYTRPGFRHRNWTGVVSLASFSTSSGQKVLHDVKSSREVTTRTAVSTVKLAGCAAQPKAALFTHHMPSTLLNLQTQS